MFCLKSVNMNSDGNGRKDYVYIQLIIIFVIIGSYSLGPNKRTESNELWRLQLYSIHNKKG